MTETPIWYKVDRLLTDDLIKRIAESTECSVCSEIMTVPVLLACGHSFCYECCSSWFENKVTCPTCRHELETPPILNVQLKEISNYLLDMIISHGDREEADKLERKRTQANRVYNEDSKNNNLFGEAFKSVLTMVDNSDGVPRCGNCHWEAHGEECLHCGARFRIARDDDYYDSAEAYDEDEDEIRLYGRDEDEDRYDSDDSFIDGRGFEEINRDLGEYGNMGSDVDSAVLDDYEDSELDPERPGSDTSGPGSSHRSWRGFNDDDRNSRSNSDDSDCYEDDLHTAINEFHSHPITISDEESDSNHPNDTNDNRRRVIQISDDED